MAVPAAERASIRQRSIASLGRMPPSGCPGVELRYPLAPGPINFVRGLSWFGSESAASLF